MINKTLFSFFVALFIFQIGFAQHNNFELSTSINQDGVAPDSSAILDIQSSNQGVLIPRITRLQRLLIPNPATSLLVYDIDIGSEGFWYYDGSQWVSLADEFLNVDDADADPTNEIELPTGGKEGQVLSIVQGEPKWIYPPMPVDSGEEYGGGIVFYIFKPGDLGYVSGEQHGLIGAMNNLDSAEWGCKGTITNATFAGIGRGEFNTSIIESSCSQIGTAADLCSELVLNGYDDWYLPTIYEFVSMRTAFFSTPHKILQSCWTSTEVSSSQGDEAYWIEASNGYIKIFDKDKELAVRPIRTF